MSKLRCPECRKKIFYIEEDNKKVRVKCNNCDHVMLRLGEEVKDDGRSIDNPVSAQ